MDKMFRMDKESHKVLKIISTHNGMTMKNYLKELILEKLEKETKDGKIDNDPK